MPRKKQYESQAEKQKAYRERQKAQESQPESQEGSEAPEEPPRPKTTGQYPKKREQAPVEAPEASEGVVQTEVFKLLNVRPLAELLALDPYAELSPGEEQVLRDHFGYASSEKRTRAERQQVAEKIYEKTK